MLQPPVGGALNLAVVHLKRLLDSFVSLRPNSRSIEYNRELLPYFYGLMRLALEGPSGTATGTTTNIPCLQVGSRCAPSCLCRRAIFYPRLCAHTSLQVLLSHRNWEWAIKYLLVESQEYCLLSGGGESDRLGPALMWLLKQSSSSPPFRQRILTATLSALKLPVHSKNIVTLSSSVRR